MNTQSAAIVKVAVAKLEIDPLNVRKTYDEKGIAEFAENIAAKGVLQNIVVRPSDKKGHFYITIGSRRFRAVKLLIEQKRLPKNYEFDCRIALADEAHAVEISLAENVMREKMSPIDEFKAFSELSEKGIPIADIAARFGTTEVIVNRRLKLARVHPAIHVAYSNGNITFEQLAAFTISDDQAAQLLVWETLHPYNRHASAIRRSLSGESVAFTDKRLVFVGLDVYEQQGGDVVRDLFDDGKSGFASNVALVEKLFTEKMVAEAEKVKAEGWAWVETLEDYSVPSHKEFDRYYVKPVPNTDDELAEIEALTGEGESLSELIDAGLADEAAVPRLKVIESRLAELDREEYDTEIVPLCGAFLTVTQNGALRVERGFKKKEAQSASETKPMEKDDTPKLSASFVEDLTAQKTAALRLEMANSHDTALAAVVHAMLLPLIYNGSSYHSCLEISVSPFHVSSSLKQPELCKALTDQLDRRQGIKDRVPSDPADLWDWCTELKRGELLELLAFAASSSLNAVEGKSSYRHERHIAHSNQLAAALGTDMRDYFEPTADRCFNHMNRSMIETAVAEGRNKELAEGISAMKKGDAAAYAEKVLKGSGWLPAPLVFGTPVLPIVAEVEAGEVNGDTDEADTAEIIQFPEVAA